MLVNTTMAELSDLTFRTAFIVYIVALIMSFVYYGRVTGIIDARREALAEKKVLVGAGGPDVVDKQSLIDASWGDNGPGWRLALLDSVETLRGLKRRTYSDLKVAFAALTGDSDPAYELRAFTPTFEDPVTGSANGAMAQWLRSRGDVPERYAVSQGTAMGRNGRVEIADDGNDIWVGGAVGVRVRGQIVVD